MAKSGVNLEELKLKRMVVSDDNLELFARSFVNFKSLVLVSCEGFSTDGLAAIASNCRFLRELYLQENEVEYHRGQWLSCIPDSCTSLVSLNFACLKGEVNLSTLERLVARCRNLRSLRLNHLVPDDSLQKIFVQAPQLMDLGVGSYVHDPDSETYINLKNVIQKCTSIRSLSGFLEVAPCCLPAVYPICMNLTSLNLSYAPGIYNSDLRKLIRHCRKLQCLWWLCEPETLPMHPVRELQERCQQQAEGLEYKATRSGNLATVEVYIDGIQVGTAQNHQKKMAQKLA